MVHQHQKAFHPALIVALNLRKFIFEKEKIMRESQIRSVGWLWNHDRSIALSMVLKETFDVVFVTISLQEFNAVGRIEGLKSNKQTIVDFYDRYGAGRP